MVPAMRSMFPLVEALVRVLLVNQASSATAARSFSSLRRLKTTCDLSVDSGGSAGQQELMKQFVLAKDNRSDIFGYVDTNK